AVKSQESQFRSLTFSKRYDRSNAEAEAAFAKPNRAEIQLFDGRRYVFEVGSVGDKTKKYFLRIRGEAQDTTPADAKAKVQQLNDLMAKNAFEVAQSVATRFEKGMSDFVTVTPKG